MSDGNGEDRGDARPLPLDYRAARAARRPVPHLPDPNPPQWMVVALYALLVMLPLLFLFGVIFLGGGSPSVP